ncbi:hypothetical protein EVAR_51318_1 [Eumeta japonica]|uniref:Uncharacterized protein n=1 Tax=Eumeta variegata TaxID=151549 RepID=A0A4C2A3K0_EUMVA|nr:hypothetical protein EVAR_51318_1 [Eumeta japonica]
MDSGVTIGRQGWQNATGPRPKRAPAQEAASSEIFFLTLYLSSEELDLTKSIPELPDAAPDTSVYSDPEQPQQGTSKNQSEPYFSVNNIASSPYVTDKGGDADEDEGEETAPQISERETDTEGDYDSDSETVTEVQNISSDSEDDIPLSYFQSSGCYVKCPKLSSTQSSKFCVSKGPGSVYPRSLSLCLRAPTLCAQGPSLRVPEGPCII